MPSQYLETCYSTLLEAAQAYCASFPRDIGGVLHSCEYAYEEGQPYAVAQLQIPSTFDSWAVQLYFPTCTDVSTPLTAADGIALGWMVGGAWLAVFALLFLTRGLRGHT